MHSPEELEIPISSSAKNARSHRSHGEYRTRELFDDRFIITHTVDPSHAGLRADHFLKRCLRSKSRAFIQKAIERGSIALKPRAVGESPQFKPSTILRLGDEITITLLRDRTEPEVDFGYNVIFEDEFIMVIDKPGNLPVHPAGRFFFNTLLTRLRHDRAEDLKQIEDHDFFLPHRIDRETSGLMVIAKKSSIARMMVAKFFDHEVEKRYFAIVNGRVKEDTFTVRAHITNDMQSNVRLKMTTCPDHEGAHAVTHFKKIRHGKRFDLLDVRMETGRQHQIRVHLSSVGLPLVGDKLYGGHDKLFLDYLYDERFSEMMQKILISPRHALHACYLAFQHPITKKMMTFESPLPPDLEALLQKD